MGKQFLYEFNGTILVKAQDENEAEKLVTGITLNNYLTKEGLFEVDDTYVATQLDKRVEQWGTELHPLDDPDEYEQYKIRKCRYSRIFNDFLNGKIDKQEMVTQMEEAENTDIPNFMPFEELRIVDLETKEEKTVRLVAVD
jgi:hypothetical protein